MLLRRAEDIGHLVRDRRHAAGLSQAALAASIGSSRQWVVELEHGNAGAEIGRVLRALSVLGISLNALLTPAVTTGNAGDQSSGAAQGEGAPEPSGTRATAFALPSLAEVLGEGADGPPHPADAGGPQKAPRGEGKSPPRLPPGRKPRGTR